MDDQTKTEGTEQATAETVEATVAAAEVPEAKEGAETTKTETPEGTKEASTEEAPLTKDVVTRMIDEAKASVKGGYEGTIAQIKKERDDAKRAVQEAAARVEQAQNEAFIRQVQEQGGDVDAAKQLVARQTVISQRERDLEALATKLSETQERLNQAAKGKRVLDLMTEYKLPKETAGELSKANTDAEMELAAIKLAQRQEKVAAKKPEKVAGATGGGQGGFDLDKATPAQMQEALKLALQGKLK